MKKLGPIPPTVQPERIPPRAPTMNGQAALIIALSISGLSRFSFIFDLPFLVFWGNHERHERHEKIFPCVPCIPWFIIYAASTIGLAVHFQLALRMRMPFSVATPLR